MPIDPQPKKLPIELKDTVTFNFYISAINLDIINMFVKPQLW